MKGLAEAFVEACQVAETGLHDKQLEQLRLYGLAFSAAITTASFQPDFDTKTIKYLVVVDPKKIEKDIGKRIAVLKVAVSAIVHGWTATVRLRQEGTVTNEDD